MAERSIRKPVSSKAAKKKSSNKKPSVDATGPLKGWTAISGFLGIPVATAHPWASEGMPVRREGRSMVADREEVSAWLGRADLSRGSRPEDFA